MSSVCYLQSCVFKIKLKILIARITENLSNFIIETEIKPSFSTGLKKKKKNKKKKNNLLKIFLYENLGARNVRIICGHQEFVKTG